MKPYALSALALSMAPALAQEVRVYGSLDTGIEYINNVGPSGDTLKRIPTLTGGHLPSRLGFQGAEDFGNGWRAVFTLESGFAVDTGSLLQNGRAFGRQSFVGISSPYGQLTLGRQWNMIFYSLLMSDFLGGSVFSVASLDSYLPSARSDNSVAYLGNFGAWTFGATYSFGRDTQSAGNCAGESSTDRAACRAWSALAKYDNSNWGASFSYDLQRGGPTATAMTVVPGKPGITFDSSSDKDVRLHYSAYAKLWELRLGFGWLDRQLSTRTRRVNTDLYYVSAAYPIGSFVMDGQIGHIDNKDMDANATIVTARGTYNLSKRTSIYGLVSRVSNNGANAVYSVSGSSIVPASPAAGRAQTGLMLGVKHTF